MKFLKLVVVFVFLIVFSINVQALSVSYTQANADPGEVMKGKTFTVTASGWSGSCTTATISFAECSGCSLLGEDEQKSISGQSSVSWTTVIANQKIDTPQRISVSVSGGCTLQQAYTSDFYVVLPPSLSVTVTPTSKSVSVGSTFSVNVNIVNNGETTAKNVNINVSSSGVSLQSGCSAIASIEEGANAAQSCVLKANTAGTHTVTFTITSSNADTVTKTITVTATSGEEGEEEIGTGGGGGGAGIGAFSGVQKNETKTKSKSKRFSFAPPGLVNNTKLLSAIEKVLAKGRLSERAKQNLMDIASVIKSDLDTSREFEYANGKSKIKTKIKYTGKKRIKNFMIYETIPKTFANNASDVVVRAEDAKIEVVEQDPSWLFAYSEVNPGDELSIEYEVSGEKSSDVIDDMNTEIYAESLEELAATPEPEEKKKICEPGETRCYGKEVQKCSDDGTKWETIEICAYICENGVCKAREEKAPSQAPVAMPYFPAIIVIIIVIVLVVAIVKIRRRSQ